MLSWFPVDSHVRNDPKVRAVRAKYPRTGLGYLLGLWSYVATEGSKADVGVGVDSAGAALNLDVMAADLDFPTVDDCRDFLTYLADVGLIEPAAWRNRATVILPAMRKRVAGYYQTKGRVPTGRGPGRPKKNPGNSGPGFQNDPPELSPVRSISGDDSGNNKPGTDVVSVTSGNPGKSGGNPGNSGPPCTVPGIGSDLDLLSETITEDQNTLDPRKAPLTPAKLVTLWNELRDPGPKVLELNDKRRTAYGRAIKAKPNAADWEAAIRYLNRASWANAPGGDGTHANFRADLDYLTKPGNVVKALERLAAMNLPGAKPARHTGRVVPTDPAKDAIKVRQDAEDEELRARGLLT